MASLSRSVAFGLLVALFPPSLFAHPLSCPVGTRPLLQSIALWGDRSPFTKDDSDSRNAWLICTGGLTLEASLVNPASAPFPYVFRVWRGTASRETMAALRSALRERRIGFLEDCDLGLSAGISVQWRITWFGRAPRANVFHLTSDLTKPPCGEGSVEILEAIGAVLTSC
jgi:hypothetical protein